MEVIKVQAQYTYMYTLTGPLGPAGLYQMFAKSHLFNKILITIVRYTFESSCSVLVATDENRYRIQVELSWLYGAVQEKIGLLQFFSSFQI